MSTSAELFAPLTLPHRGLLQFSILQTPLILHSLILPAGFTPASVTLVTNGGTFAVAKQVERFSDGRTLWTFGVQIPVMTMGQTFINMESEKFPVDFKAIIRYTPLNNWEDLYTGRDLGINDQRPIQSDPNGTYFVQLGQYRQPNGQILNQRMLLGGWSVCLRYSDLWLNDPQFMVGPLYG